MKSRIITTISFLVLILSFNSKISAQQNFGMATGNYAGITGVSLNPASIVDNRYKFDMNIAGFDSYFNNNYLKFNNDFFLRRTYSKDPYNSAFSYVKQDQVAQLQSVKERVQAGVKTNIQLPLSFMVTTGKKSAIAFTLNNRSVMQVSGMNTQTADIFYSELKNAALYNTPMNNDGLRANFLSWQEANLTYGTVLLNTGHHFIKAAFTGKLMAASAGAYIQADQLTLNFQDQNHVTIQSPLIHYGRTEHADIADIKTRELFNNIENYKFGWDAGFIYELRGSLKNKKFVDYDLKTQLRQDLNKYILRIGVAIVDVGNFNFQRKPLTKDHSANISNWDFSNVKAGNLSQFDIPYSKLVQYTSDTSSLFTYKLPTALTANIDLHLFEGFYVNLATKQPLENFGKKTSTGLVSEKWVSLTPRFESRLLGVYVPISIMYNRTNIGLTVRFGPVYVGSNNFYHILSNSRSPEADVHAGFKISIAHGAPSKSMKAFQYITGLKLGQDSMISNEKADRRKIDSIAMQVDILKKMIRDSSFNYKPVNIVINNVAGTSTATTAHRSGDSLIISNPVANGNTAARDAYLNSRDSSIDRLITDLAKTNLALRDEQEKSKNAQVKPDKKSAKKADQQRKEDIKRQNSYNDDLDNEIKRLRRSMVASDAAMTAAIIATNGNKTSAKKDTVYVTNIDSVIRKTSTESVQNTTNAVVAVPANQATATSTTANAVAPETAKSTSTEQAKAPVYSDYFNTIYFDLGVTSIKSADAGKLKRIAEEMGKHPRWKLEITGRTDASGSYESNLKVAEKRMTAVKKILHDEGITDDRLIVSSEAANSQFGQSSNKDRRVDIKLVIPQQ